MDEVKHFRLIILLGQVHKERRSVLFEDNDLDRLLLVVLDDSVEEGHRRADRYHLIIVFVPTIISRIGCPVGIPEGVDEGVECHPNRDQITLILNYKDAFLLAQEMREDSDDVIDGDIRE